MTNRTMIISTLGSRRQGVALIVQDAVAHNEGLGARQIRPILRTLGTGCLSPRRAERSSTPVISHWTRLQIRSPTWPEPLSVLRVEGFLMDRWLCYIYPGDDPRNEGLSRRTGGSRR